MGTKTSQSRVLYEEKAARERFRKALLLPSLVLGLLSLVVELSVSISCSPLICELRRFTVFTERVVTTFYRQEVVGLTCLDKDRLEDPCRLKIVLGEDRKNTIEVYNFQNGTRAFEVAESFAHLSNPHHETFMATHHGWWLVALRRA